MLTPLATIAGLSLIALVLWDAFETIVLARRVARRLRLTSLFYSCTWRPWALIARMIPRGNRRENALSVYGPMSLLMLLGLWAAFLVTGFALVQWGLQTAIQTPDSTQGFWMQLYFSGTTFFTLGLGDVHAMSTTGRVLTVLEAGTGLAFLALVIGYLPGLSQAFSNREVTISLLDARAGSPPSAIELLKRHGGAAEKNELRELLRHWEQWSAQLLESHISFPVLAYFRSQHDNQSWVAALTTILDTCALVQAGADSKCRWQANLTFAIARHALVDLCNVLKLHPKSPEHNRLTSAELAELRELLANVEILLAEGSDAEHALAVHRRLYEPWAHALSEHLLMPLPSWLPRSKAKDNWQWGS